MAIAENGMSWHLLEQMVRDAVSCLTISDRCGGTLGYNDPAGSIAVRTAIARHLEREVMTVGLARQRSADFSDALQRSGQHDSDSRMQNNGTANDAASAASPTSGASVGSTNTGGTPAIDPAHIVCAAGLTAITHLVLAALCDPGDGVLLPSPAYAGFDFSVHAVSVGAVAVRVCGPTPDRPGDIDAVISVASLEAAVNAAEGRGTPVRVLLLASPSNPTGKLYAPGIFRPLSLSLSLLILAAIK